MGRVGFNPALVPIKTDAGVKIDMAFLAHFQVSAANAVAADGDGVLTANLGAAAQAITSGLTSPAVPRALSVDGNVSGITGNVVIEGTNYAGETITETIALNGTTAVDGAKAFKTVTKVTLPVQVHTPAAQTETIEVTQAPTSDGDIAVAVTAAALGEDSPVSVTVSLVALTHDDVTKTAAAIVAALNADEDISPLFTASNDAGVITLAANAPAANDTTLSIAVTAGDTGVTVGSSTNGTTGVPYDIVYVGWNDILGLPFMLAHNTVIPGMTYLDNTAETTDPSVAVDADDIESNTIKLNSALAGKVVDAYLIV